MCNDPTHRQDGHEAARVMGASALGAGRGLTRRQFLQTVAAGTAVTTAGLALPGIARASTVWGDVPAGVWATPPDITMLEVHLLGGMAPFESFYFRPGAGLQTRGFDTEISGLSWNAACPGTPAGLVSQALASDSNAKPVQLGPFAKPFWPPHISSRMRVLVLQHDLMPHEAAIPFVMTGMRLGRPTQASLGSAIQHRYRALDQDAGNPQRIAPYAYGLLPQSAGLNNLLFSMMGALGAHIGSAKPLVLRIGPQLPAFLNELGRPGMTAPADNLLDQLRGQYRDWLRYQGSSAPQDLARSKAFRDYDGAVANLFDAPSLVTLLSGVPSTINNDPSCASETGTFDTDANPTRTALEAAVFLLTQPAAQRPRYVHVVDSGIHPRGGLPYDVHSAGNATDTGSNLWNTLSTLARLIKDPANPTPQDASKLDLDKTMIVINTDFGRTPFKSINNMVTPGSLGRDHWPDAFCSVILGGPITTTGVVGSISDAANTGAVADVPFSPMDMRAALLLAMNINPFENENYPLGQLSAVFAGAVDHTAAMVALRTTILGV
jgi:hypothetical protein